ncbi:MAG TPA: ribonuclease Y [Actinomycetota bacterium]|jgi:ribonuclease Y|nr:ribonuclease Y [Actinomycetota bacterium]
MEAVIAGLLGLAAGATLGFVVRNAIGASNARTAEARAKTVLLEAEEEAARTRATALKESKDEASRMRRETEEDLKHRRDEVARLERRITETEAEVRERGQRMDARASDLKEREDKLTFVREQLEKATDQHRAQLERIAGMTSAEAREQLTAEIVAEAKRGAMAQVREIEQRAREEGEERARKIVTIAIQRVASEQTAESSVSVFTLPSEDMKGRIIGREGRNIRAFEAATGVNIIIDDTPEAVVLSCFDPVRREAARMTLEKLVQDGRIQPARIEEVHERSLRDLEEQIRKAGEDAVAEVGLADVHPELIRLLGRLQYRTSYGQNVLKHLVESAHIASALASEIGMDPTVARRGAFLHDIGKAVTHEVEGSHAIIGAEIARRLKEDPDVVHCIESHHGEVEQRTVDAVLAQIADSISGGRPGARRESLETYIKRLQRLEEICTTHEGVEKVFAMQAGREVRVMVVPEDVDDIQAQTIARDIAKQVEEELQYPGQIKISVIRETRATEFAR